MNELSEGLEQEAGGLDLRQFFALVWKWKQLIVVAAVICGTAAFFISKNIKPIYEASTTVLVNEAPSTQSSDYNSLLTSTRLTSTYSEMMTDELILDEVARQVNYPAGGSALKNSVSASPVKDTQLITVSVRSTDPAFAMQAANIVVDVFTKKNLSIQLSRFNDAKESLQTRIDDLDSQIKALEDKAQGQADPLEKNQLENQVSQLRGIYSNLVTSLEQIRLAEMQHTSNIVQLKPATLPKAPISPKIWLNTLLATLVGMMAVTGAVILIDMLDDSIHSPEQVTQLLGLPVLSVITHYSGEDGKPVTQLQPRSMVSEAFRTLRTNIQYASVDSPVHTVLVTSANPNEGKTTVAVNLAVVLAQGGHKVTLVDADMRHPSIHKKLDSLNHFGLSALFVNSLDSLNGSLQPTQIENLSIVTAGDLPPNPSELLGSHKMERIINLIKEASDVVVLDTPPVMAVTDAMVLVPWVDGVLVVIESGQTRLAAARRTVEQLRRANANILGVVFNNLDLHDPRYGSQYYHYGKDGRHAISKYYFTETGEKKKKKNDGSKTG